MQTDSYQESTIGLSISCLLRWGALYLLTTLSIQGYGQPANHIGNYSFEESNWTKDPIINPTINAGLDTSVFNNNYHAYWLNARHGLNSEIYSNRYDTTFRYLSIAESKYKPIPSSDAQSHAAIIIAGTRQHDPTDNVAQEPKSTSDMRDYLEAPLKYPLSSDSVYCLSTMVLHKTLRDTILQQAPFIGQLSVSYISARLGPDRLHWNDRVHSGDVADPFPGEYAFITNNKVDLYAADSTFLEGDEWIQVSALVRGDSAHKWISFGNFDPWSTERFRVVTPVRGFGVAEDTSSFAYYGIDEVRLIAVAQKPRLADRQICPGEVLTVDPGAGLETILWSTGETSPSISISAPGVYSYEATVAGCHGFRDTIIVEEQQTLQIPNRDTAVCELGAGILLQTPESTRWANQPNNPLLEISEPSSYRFAYDNGCGSVDTSTYLITSLPDAPIEGLYDLNASACDLHLPYELTLLDGGIDYELNGEPVLQNLRIEQPGVYDLVAANTCGTSISTIAISRCEASIYLPTAFSPNQDGTNDVWKPEMTHASTLSLEVYGRWGELLHKEIGPSASWNGDVAGQPADIGVYVVLLRYRDEFGEDHLVTEAINLLR